MEALEVKPGSQTSGAVAQAVASEPAAKPAGTIPALPAGSPPDTPSGPSSVAAFGGLRGGKARRDGLVPGSPEALEADKKADRERKRKERRERQNRVPPPLPASAPGVGPGRPPVDLLGTEPALETVPVLWEPADIAGLVDELIAAAEKGRVESFLARCAEAGLTGKLVKEIEKDARFPDTAKALLRHSLPRLAAKWLNKAGISPEWRDEVSVVTALVLIVVNDRKTIARFNELLEAVRAEKKAAQAAKEAK